MQNTEFTKTKEAIRANIATKRPIFINFISWSLTARQVQVVKELLKDAKYEPDEETLQAIVPERREAAKRLECLIPQMQFAYKSPT